MRHKSVPIRRGVGSGYGDILIHMQSPDMNDAYNPQHLCINTIFLTSAEVTSRTCVVLMKQGVRASRQGIRTSNSVGNWKSLLGREDTIET